jgi:cellulose synthase/poly-beta-1,6-N-acetylglucosamine synthase-like glycosyltransferase
MSGAELLLIENFLWDFFERRQSRKYFEQYKPFPLPSEDDRRHGVSNVSVVVPTVGWDDDFPKALISWLANNPREVIVVTIDSELERMRAVLGSAFVQDAVDNTNTQLKLLTIPRANKRDQLVAGINESEGSILTLADDDTFWNPTTLLHLFAPFQEADVGLVGGPIECYIPEERRDPDVITPWEVAGLRDFAKRRDSSKAFYAADGSTNYFVWGATIRLRAEILKDPGFQRAFTAETFMGERQNSGDDAFITRWVLFQHLRDGRRDGIVPRWRLGMQFTPEAAVWTSLLPDRRFARQMKRWSRTNLRFRITCLFYEPGLLDLRRDSPYMWRKMAEGMYNPIITLLWCVALFQTLRSRPLLAVPIAMWYLYGLISGMMAFAREFPSVARRYGLPSSWTGSLSSRIGTVGLPLPRRTGIRGKASTTATASRDGRSRLLGCRSPPNSSCSITSSSCLRGYLFINKENGREKGVSVSSFL